MKKIMLIMLFALLLASASQECSNPMATEMATVTVQIVWQWSSDQEYMKGDMCWRGTYDDGENRNWESLQDYNIGHKPCEFDRILGWHEISPDWWRAVR